MLVDAGADLHAVNAAGKNVLHIAANAEQYNAQFGEMVAIAV